MSQESHNEPVVLESDPKLESLWERYRSGDKSSENDLVEWYLPLVKVTVSRIGLNVPAHISREEMYSAGLTGLFNAIRRYDHSREAKFTTYAITRIRGAILDELRHQDLLGRVTRERLTRIQNAEAELAQTGQDPDPEDIAAAAGLSMDEYIDASRGALASHQISLSELLEDGTHSLEDLLPSRQTPLPGYEMEMAEILELVMSLLTEREKILITLYYQEELTLKEIGALMDVSESRVCQIHAQMTMRIRKKLEKAGVMKL